MQTFFFIFLRLFKQQIHFKLAQILFTYTFIEVKKFAITYKVS